MALRVGLAWRVEKCANLWSVVRDLGIQIWKVYHIFKAFSSALRGNLGWATYHSAKAIAWKTKRKNPHKAQQNLANTKEASTTLQGVKIYLKGVDRTNEIKHFSMDKDKSLAREIYQK